nr:acylglycerol kinase family protein [Ardenticatenales bacterium]
MDELIFLVNPTAGDEGGQVAWPKIEAVLREEGVPYRVEAPASAEEMTARAQEWALYPVRALVVVGGDGTVH